MLYPLSYGASSLAAFAILVLGIVTLGATIAPFQPQVSSMAHWRKKRAAFAAPVLGLARLIGATIPSMPISALRQQSCSHPPRFDL